MSARSGLVGNKSSRPYLGPSEARCGALAAIHPGWGNRVWYQFPVKLNPTVDAEPALADRHLILLLDGMEDLTETDHSKLFIHLWWG